MLLLLSSASGGGLLEVPISSVLNGTTGNHNNGTQISVQDVVDAIKSIASDPNCGSTTPPGADGDTPTTPPSTFYQPPSGVGDGHDPSTDNLHLTTPSSR